MRDAYLGGGGPVTGWRQLEDGTWYNDSIMRYNTLHTHIQTHTHTCCTYSVICIHRETVYCPRKHVCDSKQTYKCIREAQCTHLSVHVTSFHTHSCYCLAVTASKAYAFAALTACTVTRHMCVRLHVVLLATCNMSVSQHCTL